MIQTVLIAHWFCEFVQNVQHFDLPTERFNIYIFLLTHYLKLINNDENCEIIDSKSFHIRTMFGLDDIQFL